MPALFHSILAKAKANAKGEWVTLPKVGDCVSLRVDPVASAEHLKLADVTEVMKAQPTKLYLGIVTKVICSVSFGSIDSVLTQSVDHYLAK